MSRLTLDEMLKLGPARVVIRRHWDRGGYDLHLLIAKHDPAKGYLKRALRIDAIEVSEDDGTLPPQAPIFLDNLAGGVQEIMDDLWRDGVRPTDYRDSTATREHLTHVTKLLDTVLPLALRPAATTPDKET